jgi:hypothetical protein
VTDDVVAVRKPAGMPVHVAGQYRKNTVAGVLQVRWWGYCRLSSAAAEPPPASCLLLLLRLSPSPWRQAPASPESWVPTPPCPQAERPDLCPLLPVHRLDKPVSGLLLFARHAAAADALRLQIEVRVHSSSSSPPQGGHVSAADPGSRRGRTGGATRPSGAVWKR